MTRPVGARPEEAWRAITAMLREKGLPDMREHADRVKQLEQHAPDQLVVTLGLTDDVFLLSAPNPRRDWRYDSVLRQ